MNVPTAGQEAKMSGEFSYEVVFGLLVAGGCAGDSWLQVIYASGFSSSWVVLAILGRAPRCHLPFVAPVATALFDPTKESNSNPSMSFNSQRRTLGFVLL